ncbi:MAG: desulfoferrodoxin [Lachnospiraceae bacterium]|nr:desulfoferrodoxin [Lachnospiraceae bacterium]
MKFYICSKCGKIVGMVRPSRCDTYCCDQPMEEMIANTSDGAHEKHVPAVTVEGNTVKVRVGEVDHPMLEEHHIMWVALETAEGAQRKVLSPGSAPEVSFALTEGDKAVAAYEYCNLHGLWKKEI